MIRTEREYKEALRRIHEHDQYVTAERVALRDERFNEEEIDRLMEPAEIFFLQLTAEIDWYDKAKRGDLPSINSFKDVGRHLIALRIYLGVSQTELARRLGVGKSVICRYERNEYHGIGLEHVQEVVDALCQQPNIQFEPVESDLATVS